MGINSIQAKLMVGPDCNNDRGEMRDYSRYLLSMVGCILEQGSNHCSSRKQTRPLVLLASSAVIASLILSNAYKGDNINKINSPLREVVYDSLGDVLKHKFNIFSSITKNIMKRDTYYEDKNITKEYLREFTVATHAWKQFVSKPVKNKRQRREHWLNELVKKHSPRHRFTLNCFEPLDLNGGKARQCSWHEYNELGKLQGLLEDICVCNQTAFIEDEWFLKNYLEPAVKQNGKDGAVVHVGKSNLLDILHGIVLENMVVPDLNERIDRLAASGIVGRMNSLRAHLRLIMAMNTLHHVTQPALKTSSYKGLTSEYLWKFNGENNTELENRQYAKVLTDKLTMIRKGLGKHDMNLQPRALSVNGNTVTLFIVVMTLHVASIILMCTENFRNIYMYLCYIFKRFVSLYQYCSQRILMLQMHLILGYRANLAHAL